MNKKLIKQFLLLIVKTRLIILMHILNFRKLPEITFEAKFGT